MGNEGRKLYVDMKGGPLYFMQQGGMFSVVVPWKPCVNLIHNSLRDFPGHIPFPLPLCVDELNAKINPPSPPVYGLRLVPMNGGGDGLCLSFFQEFPIHLIS